MQGANFKQCSVPTNEQKIRAGNYAGDMAVGKRTHARRSLFHPGQFRVPSSGVSPSFLPLSLSFQVLRNRRYSVLSFLFPLSPSACIDTWNKSLPAIRNKKSINPPDALSSLQISKMPTASYIFTAFSSFAFTSTSVPLTRHRTEALSRNACPRSTIL